MKIECEQCGRGFSKISNHWEQSKFCQFPKLSKEQYDIITGVLMGDGCINKPGKNAQLVVEMVNKTYLEWLSSKLSPYGTEIYKSVTAEQSAKKNRDRGFRPNAKDENYSDIYRLNTRTSPELNEFYEWYSSGSKTFPENIEITPTVLKNWYVCDGHYATSGNKDRIEIAATNEIDRFDKLRLSFEDVGLEARSSGKTIYFSNSESDSVFDYMGESIPGFDYKWP